MNRLWCHASHGLHAPSLEVHASLVTWARLGLAASVHRPRDLGTKEAHQAGRGSAEGRSWVALRTFAFKPSGLSPPSRKAPLKPQERKWNKDAGGLVDQGLTRQLSLSTRKTLL